MRKYIFFLVFVSFIFLAVAAGQDSVDNDDKMVVKTVDNLRFRVPEDLPIEKKDGVIAPMDVTNYVAMKFDKLNMRLEVMEDSISQLKEEIRLLKEQMASLKKQIATRNP